MVFDGAGCQSVAQSNVNETKERGSGTLLQPPHQIWHKKQHTATRQQQQLRQCTHLAFAEVLPWHWYQICGLRQRACAWHIWSVCLLLLDVSHQSTRICVYIGRYEVCYSTASQYFIRDQKVTHVASALASLLLTDPNFWMKRTIVV